MATMTYVYAVRRPAALPGVAGIDGAPLETVAAGGLEAVVSDSPRPPEAAGTDLLAHAAVVDALVGTGGVLPVRFGTRVTDRGEVRRLLHAHRARLTATLEVVRGHAELGVRVLWEPPTADRPAAVSTSATSGRAYLQARAAEERTRARQAADAERRADVVHEPLAAAAAASTRRVLPDPRTLMAGAYLVPQRGIADFWRTVEEVDRRHPDLEVVPTGPWPPYSFAPSLHDDAEDEGAPVHAREP